MGPKTKIKTGGKKFDEQKYERKIRAPGDKLFTHQFQTVERILAPDWAEKFSAQSGASIRSAHYLPLGLRGWGAAGTWAGMGYLRTLVKERSGHLCED